MARAKSDYGYQVFSSYAVKIKNYNNIFRETIAIYRGALSFLVGVVDAEWERVCLYPKGNEQMNFVQRLVHTTEANQAEYLDFDQLFYKYPSYLRRQTITDAIGIVSSYRSNLANWEKSDRSTRPPRLQKHHHKFPSLCRNNMFVEDAENPYRVRVKIYRHKDWVWLPLDLNKGDMDYILRRKATSRKLIPTLEKKGQSYYLRFAFEDRPKFEKEGRVILSIDLGVNTDTTAVAMCTDGTILGRHFISLSSDKDRMYTNLNRIKRNQRRGNRENRRLWNLVKSLNQSIAHKLSQSIVDIAIYYSADVIVFEYLDTKGKKKGSKKEKLHFWKHRAIHKTVKNKAHLLSIRVAQVNAFYTSRLAFDGSGEVLRGKDIDQPYSIVQFQNGKRYNADLNAAYNIGARYLIRQILKPLSEKRRLDVEAKVPSLSNRSKCTLADLINLNSVLGGIFIIQTSSWGCRVC